MRRRFKLQILAASAVLGGALFVPTITQAQSPAAAQEIRFQELEREIRRLTSQVEEQNYEIRTLKDELAKKTGDLEVRLGDIERGGAVVGQNGVPYTAQPSIEPTGSVLSENDLGEPPVTTNVINEEPTNS